MPSWAPYSLWARSMWESSLVSWQLPQIYHTQAHIRHDKWLGSISAALRADSLVNKTIPPSFWSSPAFPPVHTAKVMKWCCGNISRASPSASSNTEWPLRTAWRRTYPTMSGSPDAASHSRAQWSKTGGLLSPCQAACWETSGDMVKSTRLTCVSWLMRLLAALTPGL